MGYRAFSDRTTFDDAVDDSAFTVEGLDAYDLDAGVRALASPLTKQLEQEGALVLALRKSRRALVRANARVRTADGIADDDVREFVKDVLAEVRQNRQAPLYVDLFATGTPTALVDLSL